MSRNNSKVPVLRAHGYAARPKRTETIGGVTHSYWTVRCRRKGEDGEWALGTFTSRRAAEEAFYDWMAKHKPRTVASNGAAKMVDALASYIEMVETMVEKRPNTILNRRYTATQLRQFVEATNPELRMAEFDDRKFNDYLVWLTVEQGLKPQTVLNAMVGARTFLRWAVASNLVANPPKAPQVHVPPVERAAIFQEDIDAILKVAEPRLAALLRVLWEAGLRYSEATTLRRCDIDPSGTARVISRATFQPKTKHSARTVPISGELAKTLLDLAKEPDDFVFPCPESRDYHYWRHRLHQAQKQAGVHLFNFHDLRRAVADRMRRAGVPLDVYCKYMGHSPITGLRHYSVVLPDDLRAAHEQAMKTARRRSKE